MTDINIRSLERNDETAWRKLWDKYLTFYKSEVSDETTQATFERFFIDGPYEPNCLVAEQDGELVGFVHLLYHRHTWRVKDVCYLQDLFADQTVRGKGIGRKLIEAVYERADRDGMGNVYWMTEHTNTEARKLYDRIGDLTPFIKYQR